MPRNLDLTALRSFVMVADAGGVTKASGFLNLTQSAVSMQLKRLEVGLGLQLLDRSARSVSLTGAGEQLLGYARRLLDLNDEVFARLTHQDYEGEIVLGVPGDIVYPFIPQVLHRFAADFPRVKVHLVSSMTRTLKPMFDHGDCDMILTTEEGAPPGCETLAELPLIWVGAPGGSAWKQRPLRLAFERGCIFRTGVQRALDEDGIPWEMTVESDSTRTIEASVSADLAVHVAIDGTQMPQVERIQHAGALPELTSTRINLYLGPLREQGPGTALADLIRQAFRR